jgi:hypothetical protein
LDSAASPKRVLNLRNGICGSNQVVNRGFRRVGIHLHAISDVAGWFAGIPERASHLDLDSMNSNAALRRLTIEVVAKAGSESREQ